MLKEKKQQHVCNTYRLSASLLFGDLHRPLKNPYQSTTLLRSASVLCLLQSLTTWHANQLSLFGQTFDIVWLVWQILTAEPIKQLIEYFSVLSTKDGSWDGCILSSCCKRTHHLHSFTGFTLKSLCFCLLSLDSRKLVQSSWKHVMLSFFF